MSDEHHIEAAARHAEASFSWGLMEQLRHMPLEQLMEEEECKSGTCEFCEVNLGRELKGVKAETFERLFLYLFADCEPCAWELVAKRVYAIAKSYFPHLLVVKDHDGRDRRMSLEDLGHVFDEPNVKAARARWSARRDRIVSKPVRESGSTALVSCQKSASARAKYSAAQKGNQNRKKKSEAP